MARPRGNKWQGDAEIDGRRVRKSFDTEAAAVAWENRVAGGLPEDTPSTLRAFVDDQFDALWGEIKRPDNMWTNLETAFRYFGQDFEMADFTTVRCDAYITWMKSEGLSNSSCNRKLSTLSKLLKRAVRCEALDKMPSLDFQKEPKGRDRVLSEIEEQRLIDRANHLGMTNAAAVINFLLYTGCRLGEAYKANRSDEMEGGYIRFRDTKNGEDRAVKLVGPAMEAWRHVCRQTNLEQPFRVLPRNTFRHHWDRLRMDLGFAEDDGFVIHMLRHTCASRLAIANVSLPKIMQWMGHKNIQTTMRYAHLAPKDLDDCARALGDFRTRIVS